MSTPQTPENPAPPIPEGVEIAPGVRVPESALRVSYARASGPGGQNVNKRATKAQLRIVLSDIPMSHAASARLARLAKPYLTEDGEILIQDDSTRSAPQNKRACIERLRDLVVRAQVIPKTRKPTKPSKGAVRRRLENKKQRSDIKKQRRGPGGD